MNNLNKHSVFFLSFIFSNVEVPQLINISIFVWSNHSEPIPYIVFLQVLFGQILEIPGTIRVVKKKYGSSFRSQKQCKTKKHYFQMLKTDWCKITINFYWHHIWIQTIAINKSLLKQGIKNVKIRTCSIFNRIHHCNLDRKNPHKIANNIWKFLLALYQKQIPRDCIFHESKVNITTSV